MSAIVSRLRHSFLAVCSSTPRKPSISPDTSPTPYHQSLLPLYTHFASVLYSICAPSTLDPFELAYVASACWPAFVQPVLDEHRQRAEEAAAGGVASPELEMPGEDMRMRLIRHFTPSVTAALEALYPRMMDAQAWVTSADIEGRESAPHGRPGSTNARETLHAGMEGLPRIAKFILVAAFLASTNPAKSDLRMFGRGLDEKKRRRKGGGFAKLQARKGSGDAKPVKVCIRIYLGKVPRGANSSEQQIPQRLSGPMPFSLDRLVAILGVLLEENDVDSRLPAPEFAYPGEYTEMEIGRTQVYALVRAFVTRRSTLVPWRNLYTRLRPLSIFYLSPC
jgi:origin recognition complex subunit 5